MLLLNRPSVGFAAGLLFGIGLCLGQMVNPARVIGFLDIFGTWDPTLVFVMAGAVVTAFAGYRLVMARGRPLLSEFFLLPKTGKIDGQLIAGAAIFGAGWGIAGFCPGPAITAIGALSGEAVVFFGAMILGLGIGKAIQDTLNRRAEGPEKPPRRVTSLDAS